MKTPAWVPSAPEVVREALIVVAGAVLAALIVGYAPELKAWIKRQWADTPH